MLNKVGRTTLHKRTEFFNAINNFTSEITQTKSLH